MSVKEKFEESYESIIEDCPQDVLEAFDFLLSECASLEESNERLRRRISALEEEKSMLSDVIAENKLSQESATDLEELSEDLTDASAALVKIQEIVENAIAVCSGAASAAAAAYERSVKFEENYPKETSPLPEKKTEKESSYEEDITEKLRNMLASDNIVDSETADDGKDVSSLIAKMLGTGDEAKSKPNESERREQEALEKAEAERLALEKAEAERREREALEKAEAERLALEKAEAERKAKEALADNESFPPKREESLKSMKDALAAIKSKRRSGN